MKIKISILITLFICFSCEEKKKQTVVKQEIFGEYFNLKKDNIDIYLPNTLHQYNLVEYKRMLNTIEDSIARESEILRYNILKYSKKNVYFFRSANHTTDVSIKMIDYYPFSKKDSNYMSSLLTHHCQEIAETTNSTCTKIKSGYSGNHKTKAFMAKFKIDSETEPSSYSTIYAVSSNSKSFIITFRSLLNRDYNKFIQKTIIN